MSGEALRRPADDTDPRSVLAQLLGSVESSVARLERDAIRTQREQDYERYLVARACAVELGLVAEAVGAQRPHDIRKRIETRNEGLEGIIRRYADALKRALPRPVRALLEQHVDRLRSSPVLKAA